MSSQSSRHCHHLPKLPDLRWKLEVLQINSHAAQKQGLPQSYAKQADVTSAVTDKINCCGESKGLNCDQQCTAVQHAGVCLGCKGVGWDDQS